MKNSVFWSLEQKKLVEHNNVFLIDWLTFTCFDNDVPGLKKLLGLDDPSIPWQHEVKFRNGYPKQAYWCGITISYGADDAAMYDDPTKARSDMGICVNLSGQGCRNFESYGHGDWNQLFAVFFSGSRYNVTRLDLAYDDHIGILDMYKLEDDTRDRNFVSRSKYAEVIWSDNQMTDIQGMTIQVGSCRSDTLIRIYDKAAERGFRGRHWIRVELQLRHDNALVACSELYKLQHIGRVAAGILRNYLTYRTPTSDSNKSRWPLASYWSRIVLDMERISLWISPGDEYNFSKTECWLIGQCGQAILTAMKMGRLSYLLREIEQLNPELAPKYKNALDEYRRRLELSKDNVQLTFLEVDQDE